MAIPVRRIARVVIRGEWVTVADGTFEVEELEFTDDEGNPLHDPTDIWAYRFVTDNADEYYGPLSAIELIKLKDVADVTTPTRRML
jgi:hypothetical protein